ncbi:hypothetical protein JTE90_014338 [Oedothorax gibbosus]|uniref:Shugoshin C-terminal domain-containing protein n=1 Tax=Oedothorax gibbosus TaxID=931172 RepID=A0AAV6TTS2_9ARAC|nr:hypothetical protein JTE90_014338 [Oedothorax gibbosus]
MASPFSRSQSPINTDKSKLMLCDKIRNAEKELQKAIKTKDFTLALLDDNLNLQKQSQIPCHNNLRKTVNDNILKAKLELDKLGKCAVRDCPYHTPKSEKTLNTKRRHNNSSSDDDDNNLITKFVNASKTPLSSDKLTPLKIDIDSINNEMQDSSHDELTDTDKDGFTKVKKKNAAKKRLISSHLPTLLPLS